MERGCVNIVHIYYFLLSSGEGCVNIVHIYYFLWSSGEGVCKYSSYVLFPMEQWRGGV